MIDALFVYGSLRSVCDNPYARRLRAGALLLGSARVTGSIFRIGEYSGFQLQPRGVVNGELWRLRDPADELKELDEYEGPEYRRAIVNAQIEEAESVAAWIYTYTGSPDQSNRIESGQFPV